MDQTQEFIYETYDNEEPIQDTPIKVETIETPNIETRNILAAEAFQYFHGKIYGSLSGPRSEYSIADSVEKRVESPFQRYARLRAEVEELQNDLSEIVREKELADQGESIWSTLQKETGALMYALENVNIDLITDNPTLSTPGKLSRALDGLSLATKGGEKVGETEGGTGGGNREGITPPQSSLVAMEKRVFALETLLGSASSSLDMEAVLGVSARGRCHSLVESLTRLERRVQLLDEGGLDSIRAKAAQLRSELEEIQRDKIRTGVSGGLAHKAIEAAQKVEIMSNKVNEIQAVAEDLPALLLRLKTLETVHLEAATFNVRLSQLDESASHLRAELAANGEVLRALKEGFAENMTLMRENVKQVWRQVVACDAVLSMI